MGTALLYLFFATAGAPGLAIADSVRMAFVPVGLFLTVLYGIHGLVLFTARRMGLRFAGRRRGRTARPEQEEAEDETEPVPSLAKQRLLVASSAAIGGPATAAALAQANGWASLTAPSLLVGNLGYAVATFLGIAFHRLCLRFV